MHVPQLQTTSYQQPMSLTESRHPQKKHLSKSKLMSSQKHPNIIAPLNLDPTRFGCPISQGRRFLCFWWCQTEDSGIYKWGITFSYSQLYNSNNHLKGILEGGRTYDNYPYNVSRMIAWIFILQSGRMIQGITIQDGCGYLV